MLFKTHFPLLATTGPTTKRTASQAYIIPPKRRKTALQECEDSSWLDHFLSCDLESSEIETLSLGSPEEQEETFSSYNPIRDNMGDFLSDEHSILETQNTTASLPHNTNNEWCIDSHQQTGIGHEYQDTFGQAISPVPTATHSLPQPLLVSPDSHHGSVSQDYVPPLEMPLQQSPMVDSSTFSMSKLNSSKEPTLLTLTSYPYRIIYCSDAFSKLCRGKAPEVGDSVFDAVAIEGWTSLRPSLTTFPTLEGHWDNKIALIPSSTDENHDQSWIRCRVEAFPISKRCDSNTLRYFAVRFTPL